MSLLSQYINKHTELMTLQNLHIAWQANFEIHYFFSKVPKTSQWKISIGQKYYSV